VSKIRLTPNASGTGTVTLTVPSTSTDRTVTLPDETGTVLTTESTVPPKVPAFNVNITSTAGFSTQTKVPFNTVVFDTDSWFDTTNNRYVPQQAGYYFFSSIVNTSGSNSPVYGQINIRKSGTVFAERFISINNNQFNSVHVTGIIDLNGSTDYVETFAQYNTTRFFRNGMPTQMTGFLIRTL